METLQRTAKKTGSTSDARWKSVKQRLITFDQWLTGLPILTLQLAIAGFQFNFKTNHIFCKDCGLELTDLNYTNVDPTAVHLTYLSGHSCPFATQWLRGTPDSLIQGLQAEPSSRVNENAQSLSEHVTILPQEDDRLQPAGDENEEIINQYHYHHDRSLRRCKAALLPAPKESDIKDDLLSERVRNETFKDHVLPGTVSGKYLAASGLAFQIRSGGRIFCPFCGFGFHLMDEEFSNSSIISLHMKRSSQCPFLTGRECGNVPDTMDGLCWKTSLNPIENDKIESHRHLHELGISYQHAKEPEFAVIDRRRSTFLTYPNNAVMQDIEALCKAGYYYAGKALSVVCFYCNVESDNWRLTENVWKRHARSSTRCPFVIAQKGEAYIRQVVEELGVYVRPVEENRINTITMRMLRPRWESTVVQQTLDMGLPKEAVKTVVINRIKKGEDDFRYAADIYRAVSERTVPASALEAEPQIQLPTVVHLPFDTEAESQHVETANGTGEDVEAEHVNVPATSGETIPATELEGQAMETTSTQSSDPQDPAAAISMAKDISSRLTCSICLSEIVGIIFLPCGHFVCCVNCAAAMGFCPICRKEIKATIKASFGQSRGVYQPPP